MAEGERTIASNRKARHEYHILERLETGIALTGTEVKSLRAGKVALREAYAQERGGELWLVGATIEPYEQGNRANHEPTRDRKLLAHKHEIEELASRVAEKGLTLIPLRLYFKDGRVKAEIALARGKEGIDKRRALADRDVRREIDREMKTRFRALKSPQIATAVLRLKDSRGRPGFDAGESDGLGSKPRMLVGLVNHPATHQMRSPIWISRSPRSLTT